MSAKDLTTRARMASPTCNMVYPNNCCAGEERCCTNWGNTDRQLAKACFDDVSSATCGNQWLCCDASCADFSKYDRTNRLSCLTDLVEEVNLPYEKNPGNVVYLCDELVGDHCCARADYCCSYLTFQKVPEFQHAAGCFSNDSATCGDKVNCCAKNVAADFVAPAGSGSGSGSTSLEEDQDSDQNQNHPSDPSSKPTSNRSNYSLCLTDLVDVVSLPYEKAVDNVVYLCDEDLGDNCCASENYCCTHLTFAMEVQHAAGCFVDEGAKCGDKVNCCAKPVEGQSDLPTPSPAPSTAPSPVPSPAPSQAPAGGPTTPSVSITGRLVVRGGGAALLALLTCL
eukprot:TRINITY_DN94379_c0_g1_i1.p1 TRINITY_DN94379_c0_g1~~TRINITY_DN94379_c0_g1_i1.p1  ORF type:complete len:339 (+),score=48.31 TRINITY_DN94379_c0_g1_i1:183-1199(+)